jgi:hypothetical protein
MVKASNFGKEFVLFFMMGMAFGSDFDSIPKVDEKKWDQHLLSCFSDF